MSTHIFSRRVRAAALLIPLVLAAGCAPVEEANPTASDSAPAVSDPSAASETAAADLTTCADGLTLTDGTLTVGTDSPAYEPYFVDDDPTNGEGFESAVAYAVAERLGFSADQVSWEVVPFNTSYKPGDKSFDFDINQISVTPKRAQVVDFSDGYYFASQAVIALKGTPGAEATSLADLKGLRLGAQTGTTSLTAITDIIKPDADPAVFRDTNAAKQAMQNDQIDALLADLPTAFYISAVEISKSTIVGQFQAATGEQEQFGMLFEKGNPLRDCVNQALAEMTDDGSLAALEQQWLSIDVPTLQ